MAELGLEAEGFWQFEYIQKECQSNQGHWMILAVVLSSALLLLLEKETIFSHKMSFQVGGSCLLEKEQVIVNSSLVMVSSKTSIVERWVQICWKWILSGQSALRKGEDNRYILSLIPKIVYIIPKKKKNCIKKPIRQRHENMSPEVPYFKRGRQRLPAYGSTPVALVTADCGTGLLPGKQTLGYFLQQSRRFH